MISPIFVPLAGRSTTKRATWRSPSCQTSSTVPTNTVSMASKPAMAGGGTVGDRPAGGGTQQDAQGYGGEAGNEDHDVGLRY